MALNANGVRMGNLEPFQISTVVKTPFGLHLILAHRQRRPRTGDDRRAGHRKPEPPPQRPSSGAHLGTLIHLDFPSVIRDDNIIIR